MDIIRGFLLITFVAIANWLQLTLGLLLVAFMGVMILQSAFTNWCPADLILRPLGLRGRFDPSPTEKKSDLSVDAAYD